MWKTLSEASQQPAASSGVPQVTRTPSAENNQEGPSNDQRAEELFADNFDALQQIAEELMEDDL